MTKEVLRRGGPYPPGRYRLSRWPAPALHFTLGPDTPDTVKLPLPPTADLRGRVVDGVTGEPLAVVAVMAVASGGPEDLNLPAIFDDGFWIAIGQAQPGTSLDASTTERLLKASFPDAQLAIPRPDGSFTLTDSRTNPASRLVLVAPGKLPATHSLRQYRRDVNGRYLNQIDLETTPLFPAALATVRSEFRGGWVRGRIYSAYLGWEIAADATPEGWRHPVPPTDGQLAAGSLTAWKGWIEEGNQTHRVFVPAGIDLRLWVDNSNNANWAPTAAPETLRIPPGSHPRPGRRFGSNPCPRLHGPRGRPRRPTPRQTFRSAARDMDDDVWHVAHLTNHLGELTIPFNHPHRRRGARVDDVGRNAPRAAKSRPRPT